MMRSDHVLLGACSLLPLAGSCLGMVARHCPGCGFAWLGSLAVAALGIATGVGLTVLMITVGRTAHFWRDCQMHRVPLPSRLRRVCQPLGLAEDQILCTAHAEPLALCIGWLHPRVVVSTGLVAQVSLPELMAILAHERRHQQRRDPLRLLVVTVLRSMLFPLPLIHDLSRSFLTWSEIEADQAAIAWSGRPALASALYKLLTLSAPLAGAPRLTAVTLFSVQTSRLAYLLDPDHTLPSPFPLPHLVVSLAPFLLLCLRMVIR